MEGHSPRDDSLLLLGSVPARRVRPRSIGYVSAHEIFVASASGEPQPDGREVEDAVWWDGRRPLRLQPHVRAILALIHDTRETDTKGDP